MLNNIKLQNVHKVIIINSKFVNMEFKPFYHREETANGTLVQSQLEA